MNAPIVGVYDVKTARRMLARLVQENTPKLPADGRQLYIAIPDGQTTVVVTSERAANGDRIYRFELGGVQ